jgi:AcrR family transcriptional regulator
MWHTVPSLIAVRKLIGFCPKGSAVRPVAKAKDDAKRLTALKASWVRQRLDTAGRIELAGLSLFVGRGFGAVTIDDIAAAAGVSRRSCYRYFRSPPDILSNVVCRAIDRWAGFVRDRPLDEPLLLSFGAAAREMANAAERSEHFRLASELIRRSPDIWQRITGPIQAHVALACKEVIAARLAQLGRDTAPASAIAAAFTAIVIHLLEQCAREGRMFQPADALQAIMAFGDLITNVAQIPHPS